MTHLLSEAKGADVTAMCGASGRKGTKSVIDTTVWVVEVSCPPCLDRGRSRG